MYRAVEIDNKAQHYERMEQAAQQGDDGAILRLAWLSRQRETYTEQKLQELRSK